MTLNIKGQHSVNATAAGKKTSNKFFCQLCSFEMLQKKSSKILISKCSFEIDSQRVNIFNYFLDEKDCICVKGFCFSIDWFSNNHDNTHFKGVCL